MSASFKPATRQGVKPLIGLFGKSGGGKTLSALLLARGLVGPNGKVGLIDTENKRGSIFADIVPGGYLTLDMEAPFHPLKYLEFAKIAVDQGIECLVIDSMTHEWNGEGGYLDLKEEVLAKMAGDDWKKRDKCAMAAAARVKPQTHNMMVSYLLRSPLALILCFRAKDRVRMEKDEQQRTKIVADEFASPIQESDLIFEMLISGEVYSREINGVNQGGFLRIHGQNCKHTSSQLLELLPREDEQISIKHGEAIAKWATGAKFTGPQTPAKPAGADPVLVGLKRELWALLAKVHKGDASEVGKAAFNQHLWDESYISDTEDPATLSVERLREVIAAVKAKGGAQ